MGSVPNERKEILTHDPIRWFKCKLKPPKNSSHWQTRDEYLIKQTKHQTTAKLDIYIKDLVRRCQFSQGKQESHKINLLYHATLHFEVRKYIHNAKPEELSNDHMIEVAKAYERTCHEY